MIRFGTDGVRGHAGTAPITAEGGLAIGQAAAQLAFELGTGRVLLARDTRPSGPALEAAVAAGILSRGGQSLLAGVLPTAGVGVCLDAELADVGVMITASHNPSEDNGFKIIGRRGRKLDASQIAKVEQWMAQGTTTADSGFGQMQAFHEDAWGTWLDALSRATQGRSALAGQRIAIDLAHGAAAPSARWLAEQTEVDWVILGDGSGVVNDGVGSENLAHLGRVVVDQGCVAGFAVDGDADRCRLVDEQGCPVPGDAVTWLLARSMSATDIAVTVMSNGALELSLPETRVVRTPVGDRFLREAMDRDHLQLGAEESGHVLFDDYPSGDGLVTGLRALTALLSSGVAASEVLSGFVPLPRRLTKVPVSTRPPLDEVDVIVTARAQELQGLGPGGRVFLRYSGTESYMRVLVEGREARAVAEVSDRMTQVCEKALS
jgi:phosphoglucosamine mutase